MPGFRRDARTSSISPRPLLVPNGYLTESGIYRVAPVTASIEVPAELQLPVRSVAVAAAPTFVDQLYSYTTAEELLSRLVDEELTRCVGSPSLTSDDVVGILRTVPLEPAIRLTAWLQRRLRLYPVDAAKQIETMDALYGPLFADAGSAVLREFPRRSLFSEQQAFALQRLLLLYADDRPAEDLTKHVLAQLLWALLWIPDAILDPDLGADQQLTGWNLADERLLRFFVANGGLASHGAIRNELARAYRMYEVIAKSRAARRHRDYCPLDEWLQEAYGLTFIELQTFGFAFYARSGIGDRDDGQMHFTNKSYFAQTSLRERYARALAAIAAPREWFIEEFTASRESPRRAAYEIQPFLRRPALLQHDGNAVVLGLRALEGWLSATGCYYRFFDIARGLSDTQRDRFRRFNGWIQERYARQLAHIAHPYPRRRRFAGTGRVFGEQIYKIRGRGELRTTDVAVDLGLDLVLIEVTSKRLTQKSLVEGNIESVIADVRALVLDKMKQIGRVVTDLVAGGAEIPGVDIALVRRIWPIIVSPEGLFHSPSLWAWCRMHGDRHLANPVGRLQRIQPVVLLDAEEYEILAGLVASGRALVRILEQKTGDVWRERDFKAWFLDSGSREAVGELAFVEEEVRRNFRAMRRALVGQDDPEALQRLDFAA